MREFMRPQRSRLQKSALTLSLVVLAAAANAESMLVSHAGKPFIEESLAQVVSRAKSDIAVEIDGIVETVDVLVGQTVTAGDPLFSMNCAGYALALRRSELALTLAERNATQAKLVLERSVEGLNNNVVSRAQNDVDRLAYETAKLGVEDMKLSRDSAKLFVDRCAVSAPFTGVVTKITTGPGSYLTAGSLALSMTETESLEVTAQLTPDEIDILGNSQELTFASGDEEFSLTLRTVEPTFDPVSGTQRVHLQLPETADLPVGMNGMLRWNGGRYSLPATYLARRGPQVGLLLEKSNGIEFMPVPGAVEGLPVIVRLATDTKVLKP